MTSESDLRVPMTKVGFSHQETRRAWELAYRRVKRRLWRWSSLCLAALVPAIVLSTGNDHGDKRLAGLIGGSAVLAIPFALYTCRGALSRLRTARSVLEVYPWRVLPAVRMLSGEGSLCSSRAVPTARR